MDDLQEIIDALDDAKKAVKEIDIGEGSEHFRHGRGTMQVDALMAIDGLIDRITDPANWR